MSTRKRRICESGYYGFLYVDLTYTCCPTGLFAHRTIVKMLAIVVLVTIVRGDYKSASRQLRTEQLRALANDALLFYLPTNLSLWPRR